MLRLPSESLKMSVQMLEQMGKKQLRQMEAQLVKDCAILSRDWSEAAQRQSAEDNTQRELDWFDMHELERVTEEDLAEMNARNYRELEQLFAHRRKVKATRLARFRECLATVRTLLRAPRQEKSKNKHKQEMAALDEMLVACRARKK